MTSNSPAPAAPNPGSRSIDGRSGVDLAAARDFIVARTRSNRLRFGDRLPAATVAGRYRLTEDGGWVGGFWNGILNLCHEFTGERSFLDCARRSWPRYLDRLRHRPESLDHDVGFLYIPSFVADYRLTGNAEARSIALEAAAHLGERFNARGGFLNAWNVWRPGEPFSEENRGRIIIDSLYNAPLLFWAAGEGGGPALFDAALAHCRACARFLVRTDGTTNHTFVFDPETGAPKYARTHQGYADDSCWARGQAWAIGGFAHAHRYSGDPELLATAGLCAEAFLARVGPAAGPCWDFSRSGKLGEPVDTSAGAIAAAGFLALSQAVQRAAADRYRRASIGMVAALLRDHSTRAEPDEEGLLRHACGHRPAARDTDCSLIYGDYFFVEAVARLLGVSAGYW